MTAYFNPLDIEPHSFLKNLLQLLLIENIFLLSRTYGTLYSRERERERDTKREREGREREGGKRREREREREGARGTKCDERNIQEEAGSTEAQGQGGER